MKTPRITSGFSSLSDANFENKAGVINSCMTGNVYFPVTTPAMPVVTIAVQDYSTSLIAAKGRDKNAVAMKNQRRSELNALLVQLANSVMAIANGDRTMLISSGFDLVKDAESIPLVKPENIQVADGVNAGELAVSVPQVKSAKGYVHQCTPDPLTPGSDWAQVFTTTSKCTFKNLESAKKYWCRVTAVGPFGQVVVSDAISRVVQ